MPDGVPLTAAELRIQVSTAKRAKKAARKAEKAAAKAAASYGSVLSQGPDSPDASNDASSFGGGNDASFGGGFSGDDGSLGDFTDGAAGDESFDASFGSGGGGGGSFCRSGSGRKGRGDGSFSHSGGGGGGNSGEPAVSAGGWGADASTSRAAGRRGRGASKVADAGEFDFGFDPRADEVAPAATAPAAAPSRRSRRVEWVDAPPPASPRDLELQEIRSRSPAAPNSASGLRMRLDFRDLEYGTRAGARGAPVLRGIGGSACPGELIAVLGPSGAGKTALVSLLAGRIADFDGSVTLNGRRDRNFKRSVALVPKDDVFHPRLTVLETLTYTAGLTLPGGADERRARVQSIVSSLRLKHSADAVISGGKTLSVSAGERKRCSIAQALVTDPAILLLDEPTSGLDSSIALGLVRTLRQLAASGKTVMATIHQPSAQIFELFDKVLLLHEGRCVYNGEASGMSQHFRNLGHDCPVNHNPADFALELCHSGRLANTATTTVEVDGRDHDRGEWHVDGEASVESFDFLKFRKRNQSTEWEMEAEVENGETVQQWKGRQASFSRRRLETSTREQFAMAAERTRSPQTPEPGFAVFMEDRERLGSISVLAEAPLTDCRALLESASGVDGLPVEWVFVKGAGGFTGTFAPVGRKAEAKRTVRDALTAHVDRSPTIVVRDKAAKNRLRESMAAEQRSPALQQGSSARAAAAASRRRDEERDRADVATDMPEYPARKTSSGHERSRTVSADLRKSIAVVDAEDAAAPNSHVAENASWYNAAANATKFNTSFGRQALQLTRRSYRSARGEAVTWALLLQHAAVLLMAGLAWLSSGSADGSADQELRRLEAALVFFSVYFGVNSLLSSLGRFLAQRKVMYKERRSGLYRLSAFCTAETLAGLPLELLYAALASPLFYWAAGLRQEPAALGRFVATVGCSVWAASGLGFAVGAQGLDDRMSRSVAAVAVLHAVLFGGLLEVLLGASALPRWVGWTELLAFSRHTLNALLRIELSGARSFACSQAAALSAVSAQCGGSCSGGLALMSVVPTSGLPLCAAALAPRPSNGSAVPSNATLARCGACPARFLADSSLTACLQLDDTPPPWSSTCPSQGADWLLHRDAARAHLLTTWEGDVGALLAFGVAARLLAYFFLMNQRHLQHDQDK